MTKCECDRTHASSKHSPHECPNTEGLALYNITDENGVIVQRSVSLCHDCHGIYAFRVDGSDGPAELRGKPITDTPQFVEEAGRQPQPDDEPLPGHGPVKKVMGIIEDHTVNPPMIYDGLTKEMSDANAKAIYPQTQQRIATLMQTLIQLTGNGDLAIWAVIEALAGTIRGLNFAAVPHINRQQFLGLSELVLTAYAERMADYRRAWDDYEVNVAALDKVGITAVLTPQLPEWTDADTLAIYEQMDTLYGPPKDEANDARS